MGGAPSGIELSIWPTFAADPEQSRDAQSVFASVSALSAGVTTLTLAERWDELSGATGSPRALAWSRLDAMTGPYRQRDGKVAFCINVVDREQPAWPFMGSLDGAAARQAMHRTIDEIYARYAAQLSHLCFGYEVDRYVAASSAEDGASLLEFLADAVSYAQQHAAHTDKIAVGVAVSLAALSDAKDNERWLLGDETIAVYDPLTEAGELKPAASGAEEVGAVLDGLLGDGRPLALWEVGYPSAAGSSEAAQRDYYLSLLELLAERREQLSFVSFFGLGDRVASDCDAEALLFGEDPAEAALRSKARCAMGLRAGDRAKLAWQTVLSALPRYR